MKTYIIPLVKVRFNRLQLVMEAYVGTVFWPGGELYPGYTQKFWGKILPWERSPGKILKGNSAWNVPRVQMENKWVQITKGTVPRVQMENKWVQITKRTVPRVQIRKFFLKKVYPWYKWKKFPNFCPKMAKKWPNICKKNSVPRVHLIFWAKKSCTPGTQKNLGQKNLYPGYTKKNLGQKMCTPGTNFKKIWAKKIFGASGGVNFFVPRVHCLSRGGTERTGTVTLQGGNFGPKMLG